MLAPDTIVNGESRAYLVEFDSEGVFGWIPTRGELIAHFLAGTSLHSASVFVFFFVFFVAITCLSANFMPVQRGSEPAELSPAGQKARRSSVDRGPKTNPPVPPRISNPIVCLSAGDMLIFALTINHTGTAVFFFYIYT